MKRQKHDYRECTSRVLITRRKSMSELLKCIGGLVLFPNVAFSGLRDDNQKHTIRRNVTGFVTDERYLLYTLGKWHPESPERLEAIYARLKLNNLWEKLYHITPTADPGNYPETIHPQQHINMIRMMKTQNRFAELAVSGVLSGVDAVCTGRVKNVFCAIRPPGHHATETGFAGFCFYNNVAIAARYVQKKYQLKKVLIVDWDFHHGNGTEWAFYTDPTVLFFSTHALYAYPHTGQPTKTGEGEGKGFNINVPLPHGATDRDIIGAFQNGLVPAAEAFKPDIIFISAGFDSRKNDVLGDFIVTDDGFTELTKIVMSIAEKCSKSRVVSVLEGGYNTEGLAMAVEAHLKALWGE
jgi:acetoin utilization deacetylase AcuC-like enzyme